jgi:hypothetical protein
MASLSVVVAASDGLIESNVTFAPNFSLILTASSIAFLS